MAFLIILIWNNPSSAQTNALLNVAPGRRLPMTGVGVSVLPVRVFSQQLFKKAKSKLSRKTPTPAFTDLELVSRRPCIGPMCRKCSKSYIPSTANTFGPKSFTNYKNNKKILAKPSEVKIYSTIWRHHFKYIFSIFCHGSNVLVFGYLPKNK